ncbi:HD-GYP domain-containing protein [Phycisphaerales bacterium AB-hyl4]|uniref:HD-GYP domain-containing protein n=1 Tax=Natronomicrosphaera hydrolytica TaxID=3242702 RepID=A0ABV4U750_9BACT
MQRLKVNQIEPGQIFSQSLFLPSGQKLLSDGVKVTERHVKAIRQCGARELLLADSVVELVAAGVVQRADRSRLVVGQTAESELLTQSGQVLLGAGEQLEQHHLDALDASGEAYEGGKRSGNGTRERILMADALLEELEQVAAEIPLRIKRANQTWIKPTEADDWPDPDALITKRDKSVEKLRTLFARVEAGVSVPVSCFDELVDDLLIDLARHPQRFTQLALLCPRRENYLPDHAYTVCTLALAIAVKLRWSRDDTRQLGTAALLADLGMLLVPERIRTGSCQLTDIDRARVHRHPVFSLAMIQEVVGVPDALRLAAVQHHERENGSGYPRGRRKNQISDIARVLAVADTFAAGTEARHYREMKLPYAVMEETVRNASSVFLWAPAVRGLLAVAGLFPVGSYIRLSNGSRAHVLASNAKMIDRPLVQLLDEEGLPKGKPIDLATIRRAALFVVRPAPAP